MSDLIKNKIVPRAYRKDDVVQITYEPNLNFSACFMIVEEVESWGVRGYVIMPGIKIAHYRAKYKDITLIGRAKYIMNDPLEFDPAERSDVWKRIVEVTDVSVD